MLPARVFGVGDAVRVVYSLEWRPTGRFGYQTREGESTRGIITRVNADGTHEVEAMRAVDFSIADGPGRAVVLSLPANINGAPAANLAHVAADPEEEYTRQAAIRSNWARTEAVAHAYLEAVPMSNQPFEKRNENKRAKVGLTETEVPIKDENLKNSELMATQTIGDKRHFFPDCSLAGLSMRHELITRTAR